MARMLVSGEILLKCQRERWRNPGAGRGRSTMTIAEIFVNDKSALCSLLSEGIGKRFVRVSAFGISLIICRMKNTRQS